MRGSVKHEFGEWSGDTGGQRPEVGGSGGSGKTQRQDNRDRGRRSEVGDRLFAGRGDGGDRDFCFCGGRRSGFVAHGFAHAGRVGAGDTSRDHCQEIFSSVFASGGVRSVVMRDGPGLTAAQNVSPRCRSVAGPMMIGYPAQTTVPFYMWHSSRGEPGPDLGNRCLATRCGEERHRNLGPPARRACPELTGPFQGDLRGARRSEFAALPDASHDFHRLRLFTPRPAEFMNNVRRPFPPSARPSVCSRSWWLPPFWPSSWPFSSGL